MVMQWPLPLAKTSGFALVSECSPGFISVLLTSPVGEEGVCLRSRALMSDVGPVLITRATGHQREHRELKRGVLLLPHEHKEISVFMYVLY
jgi:hypothetical protein